MNLSTDQVKKAAKLANLPLSSDEEELYSEQLSKILDYIDQLNTVDTEGVEPTFNVTGLVNVMSEDKIISSLPQDEVLKSTSNKRDGFFIAKGVFEE